MFPSLAALPRVAPKDRFAKFYTLRVYILPRHVLLRSTKL